MGKRIYQYRVGLTKYNIFRLKTSSKKRTRLSKLISAISYRPVYSKEYSLKAKIEQTGKLLNKCAFVNRGKGFIYSIDERCYPILEGEVIDNMPIDYSVVVDYSLEDIREYISVNHFNPEITEMIDVLENYIDKFCKHSPDSQYMQFIKGLKNKKAGTLDEALQRILFINQLLWQTQHKLVGLGRLDKVLDRFDAPDNAKQIISDFLATLHEFYSFKSSTLMGDTGQIVLLGGSEPDGTYFNNVYTKLFIECAAILNLPDPKYLLRVSQNTPDDLIDTALDCISKGTGSPLISNDEVIIPLLIDFGYDRQDAYNYGVSACWEPLSIGNSLEQNNLANIEYGKAASLMIKDCEFVKCQSKQDLRSLYWRYLKRTVDDALSLIDGIVWEFDPIQTLFSKECLKNGKDISQGGAKYNNYGILSIGLSSAVDSINNIEHFCFDDKSYTLQDIHDAITNNYEGYDELRNALSANTGGFGTESPAAIELCNSVISETSSLIENYKNKFGGKVKFGLSSPGYISSGKNSGATADGRKSGEPFATHISKDSNDSITQILNFASSLRFDALSSNANVVDIMVQPNLIIENRQKFRQIIVAAIRMGVFQMQFNVVSYAQLVDAKAHPDKYPFLIVRVWGFSAYFRDLPERYQNQLIFRAKQAEGIV